MIWQTIFISRAVIFDELESLQKHFALSMPPPYSGALINWGDRYAFNTSIHQAG
jgi:hypothetical protein